MTDRGVKDTERIGHRVRRQTYRGDYRSGHSEGLQQGAAAYKRYGGGS